MAQQYAYNYAHIDEDNMCDEVLTRTREIDTTTSTSYIEIPEYNEEYLFKYYNRADGKWYEDAEFTTEWTPE